MNPKEPSENVGCLLLPDFIAVNTLTTKSNSPPQVNTTEGATSTSVGCTIIGEFIDEQSDTIPPKDPPPSA
jgi:hypothetical protein